MINNYTIITIPQWAIFAGITVIIYGWTEKKQVFETIGFFLFLALGIFAVWVIFSGLLIPEEMLNPSDPQGGEKIFDPSELPVSGRLLPHYWGLAFNGFLSLAGLLAAKFNRKITNILKIITITLSIMIFFMMMAVVKS